MENPEMLSIYEETLGTYGHQLFAFIASVLTQTT